MILFFCFRRYSNSNVCKLVLVGNGSGTANVYYHSIP